MGSADDLLRQIRDELAPMEDRLRAHPYIAGLERGDVPKEGVAAFVGEQHVIIESDLRSFATLVSRCETPRPRALFLRVLASEQAEVGALRALARGLGLDEAWLESYRLTAEAQAYCHYVAWLAHYATPAEVAGGMAVNFPAWGQSCARMGSALRERYGLSAEATAFFDMFSETSSEAFSEEVAYIVDEGLASGVEDAWVRRTARLLQAYEIMFWDALHEASLGM